MHFDFIFLLLIGNAMQRKEIKENKEETKEKLGKVRKLACCLCVVDDKMNLH
jgi:hypothetical protein